MDSRLILNGHDEPITDLHAVTETIRQNIIRRIGKAINAMSEQLTIAEICSVVYGETGGYNQLLVMEKTGAYVEYLYEHGMIEIANAAEMEQGLPARYRRLRDEDVLMEEIERMVNRYTSTHVNRSRLNAFSCLPVYVPRISYPVTAPLTTDH